MKKRRKIKHSRFINSKVTATISISLVLFLLGLIILLSLLANNLSNHIKETLSFDIVLQDEISSKQVDQLQKSLDEAVFVKSTQFISKEDAALLLEEELGENPEEFLGFNPLPAIIVVNLTSQYANTDSIAVIENQLLSYSTNIKEIQFRKELLQLVNENMKKVGIVLLGLAVLLLIISFALINNTIRLMIYSKRFLINTMKLVGAKNSFIRKPFIRTNLVMGIIASIIASGLLYWLYYYISTDIELYTLLGMNQLLITFGCIFVLGIIISITATYFAVNKYVRLKSDDLYYV